MIALIVVDMALAASFGAWAESRARRDGAQNAEAAIIFYADSPRGERDRLATAMALWREGRVGRLYFVGGARPSGSGAARQAARAVAAGAPADLVASDLISFDTETNVVSACAAITQQHWRSVALVSDAMHIVRIHYLLRRAPCAATKAIAAPTPTPDFGQTWQRAHYEAVAWVVDVLLPPSMRVWLLRQLRQ